MRDSEYFKDIRTTRLQDKYPLKTEQSEKRSSSNANLTLLSFTKQQFKPSVN